MIENQTENFSQLFESSLQNKKLHEGALITATVIDIDKEFVTVSAGLKSDGCIPLVEFKNEEVRVGDTIEVVLESLENGFGETRLSREKALRAKAWVDLEKAFEAKEIITGTIIERVKGGFTVELGPIRAFLPGSLVDVKPVRDPGYLEGKALEFKVIKMDKKRNNVVVSRRAVMEAETREERMLRIGELQEGQEIIGVVKNITDYGAFVELGGIDGLLHITDLSWKRVKHPSEMLTVGNEIKVKVLKFDREKQRVSLGLKQLGEDPWVNVAGRYPSGTRLSGKVTNITDYGCFVELEQGVEGLVHMSEMDWTNKNIHPSKVVALGDVVEVMVLEIDEERRRISLGMKQCVGNPWYKFSEKHAKNEKVKGKIRSITDFGIFIGLDGEIDGLIHISDISWDTPGEEAVKQFKKGQEIEAVILSIDADRERISLGLKQLHGDAFLSYTEEHQKGSIVECTVTTVEDKSLTVSLAEEVNGVIRATEVSDDKVDDLTQLYKEGDKVEAKITAIDKKNRSISLSIKAKAAAEEKAAIKKYAKGADSAPSTTLGDIFKDKISNKDEEK